MWPTDRHGLVHRDDALQNGISDRRIAAAVRTGELIVAVRGTYLPAAVLVGRDDSEAHVYRQRCIAAALGPGRPVLSHDSAAAVHGIDLLYPDRSRVHVTNGRLSGGSRRPRRVIHNGLLADDDVVELDGVRVTSAARTVADIALSTTRLPQALTALDSGLRAGLLVHEIEPRFHTGRRNCGFARHALSFADGDSASPGESWSRAQMIEARLPLPRLQVEYRLASGRRAFCDFGVDDRFVGEFDGLIKYRRDMRGGEEPEEVVIREKLREDELRDLGLDVARWIWDDLRARRLVPRLERHYDKLGIRY
ncbi:hypothetical protein [Gordonia neofelifaecis]|uniref:Transcriptional regulator, AbiEi antitoxin, Type IV TA system n=1 Tax=Gordonia neofelifaecis NRRL B-59395 TaxID=644548 RepID=F1YFN1_9ACTN|nr:hypothetical protein [Gordonia neofelifaecis]EGD56663.1 hypothetical protein SCNU_03892 [Gordonia neofelifaecis NRRL B-59395]